MEIIILTSIICTLFATFIFGPMVYAHKQEEKSTDKVMTKKKILKRIDRTLADMETNGIYFSQEVKDELVKQREELLCNYSGLPSTKSYEQTNEK